MGTRTAWIWALVVVVAAAVAVLFGMDASIESCHRRDGWPKDGDHWI